VGLVTAIWHGPLTRLDIFLGLRPQAMRSPKTALETLGRVVRIPERWAMAQLLP